MRNSIVDAKPAGEAVVDAIRRLMTRHNRPVLIAIDGASGSGLMATSGLMLGHLYFGRFEEHKPRWRRLLKSLLASRAGKEILSDATV